jgi:hypothetical protein
MLVSKNSKFVYLIIGLILGAGGIAAGTGTGFNFNLFGNPVLNQSVTVFCGVNMSCNQTGDIINLNSLSLKGDTGAAGSNATVQNTSTISFIVNNNQSVIIPGIKGFIKPGKNGTLNSITIISNETGSVTLDILKSNYSSYPAMTTITSGGFVVLSSAQKMNNLTLPGYNTTIDINEFYIVNVKSATTIKLFSLFMGFTWN